MSAAHVRRVTTRGLLSVLAASTLVLAACSQTVGGTATLDPNGAVVTSSSAGRTTSSSSSATSTSSRASTTEESSPSESSSPESTTESSTSESSTAPADPTAGGSPVDPEAALDADTLGFFQTFCGGVTDAQQYASPSTTGQTLEEAQTTLYEAYANIAASAQVTAGILQSSPPPTFADGAGFADAATNQFLTLADVYGRGSDTIAALQAPTEQDLRDAVDAIEGEASAAQNAAPAFPPVPAELQDAVKAVPECAGVL
jgi:hypothetical protein